MKLIYNNSTMPISTIDEYRIKIAIPLFNKLKYYDYDYELPYAKRKANETDNEFEVRCEERARKYSRLDEYIIGWEKRICPLKENDWYLANAKIPLDAVWELIPERVKDYELYDSPLRYGGVSSLQYLFEYGDKEIYVTESSQYREILNQILKASQQEANKNLFGTGAGNINKLLFKIFKSLYPKSMCALKEGSEVGPRFPLFEDEAAYYDFVVNKLKVHHQLIIYKNSDLTYTKVIVPIYRKVNRLQGRDFNKLEVSQRFEFTGGLLHYIQHNQLNGKPISAISKSQLEEAEFDESILIQNIIDGIEVLKGYTTQSWGDVDFTTKKGKEKTIGAFFNKAASVFFVNTIYQKKVRK